MQNIKGVLIDTDWVQWYDNLKEMRSFDVPSGLYTNYFMHLWQTVSTSPFSNAVAFYNGTPTATTTFNVTVAGVDRDDDHAVYTLECSRMNISSVSRIQRMLLLI